MVSNNKDGSDQDFVILANLLVERLKWAREQHVRGIPKPYDVSVQADLENKQAQIETKSKREEGSVQIVDQSETENEIKSLLNKGVATAERLEDLRTKVIGDCSRCQLCESRSQIVFGSGDVNADLVFVGEGPGAEEDRLGEPFVGRSGKLLTKMIEAMGLSRDKVFICNVVKCRPPKNRDPNASEVSACLPFLKAQLAIIQPKVIVALGRYACQTLLESSTPMSKLRGIWTEYEGIDFMPTFHPAFLLRNPPKKKEVWQDLQAVIKRLGLNPPV